MSSNIQEELRQSTKPPLEIILGNVEKLDIGEAKKIRIRSFVRKSYRIHREQSIDLSNLSKLSRQSICHETQKL